MFVQKLNPLTGEADWVLVNEPGLGDEDDASADLVATSSYLDMLTDSRRNVAYNAALRRVIPASLRQVPSHASRSATAARPESAAAETAPSCAEAGLARPEDPGAIAQPACTNASTVPTTSASTALTASGVNGDSNAIADPSVAPHGSSVELVRVLDIGTGTGLLAMMAARALGCSVGPSPEGPPAAAAAATQPPNAPPSAPVVACEVFPPMQNLARKVVAANGLGGVVRVVDKRSDEIVVRPPDPPGQVQAAAPEGAAARRAATKARAAAAAAGKSPSKEPDMYGKADVIVTEIFDSELLGEGMIPTMRHAVQHLLNEGGVVIPATSRVYGQVVQCPLMHQMTGLRLKEALANGKGASLRAAPGEQAGRGWEAGSAAAAEHVLGALRGLDAGARATFFRSDELYEVREMHVDLLHQYDEARRGRQPRRVPVPDGVGDRAAAAEAPAPASGEPEGQATGQDPQVTLVQPLSEPFLVFDFDWLRPPPPAGRRITLEVPATGNGSAHAVLLWWQLGMVPDALQEVDTQQAPQPQLGQQPPQEQSPGSGAGPQGAQQLLLSTAPVWLGGRPEAGGDGGPLEGVEQRWRDHWKQCWCQLADDAPAVRPGDVLRLSFEHDDLNIRHKLLQPPPPPPPLSDAEAATAAVATTSDPAVPAAAAAPAAAPGPKSAKAVLAALQAEAGDPQQQQQQQLMPLLSWLGPQALLQLGDADRLATFGSALEATLAEAGVAGPATAAAANSSGGKDATDSGSQGTADVVVVDGSLALGLLAATHPAVGSVTLLQDSNVAASNWLKAAAAKLGVAAKVRSQRCETYLKRLAAAPRTAAAATAAAGTAAATGSGVAGGPSPLVLVSEPYFSEFEQLVPWAHLKFWRDYDVIRGSAAVAAGAKGGAAGRCRVAAFPRRARLVAVAAALPELWRTRCALGRIEGLDLTAANTVLGVVGADDEVAAGAASGGAEGPGPADSPSIRTRDTAQDDGHDDVWGGSSDSEGEGEGNGGGRIGSGGCQLLPILPYSIWQAGGGYEELSGRKQLLSLDCGGHLEDVEGEATLVATRGSVCHAIVLWMDFDLAPQATSAGRQPRQPSRGAEGGSDAGTAEEAPASGPTGAGSSGLVEGGRWLTVSTAPAADGGPGPSVQGVYLLRQPVELTRGSRLHVAAQFDGLDADVTVEVTVLPPP